MLWNPKQGRFGKQLDRNIQAINEGDYRWIPWIFCVFTENHGPSKRAAAQALSTILNRLEFADIIRIDEQMRQTTSMEWNINWHKLKIRRFFTPDMTFAERRAVLIFASFNPNGFIREKAVKMMGEYRGTLPYVLMRLNDWVAQVRKAALDAFDRRLQRLVEGELLKSLPFIEKLQKSSRGSYTQYKKRLFKKLTSDEYCNELEEGLQSKNNHVRAMCIHAMLETPAPDVGKVITHLKRERDPFLRLMIFKSLCTFHVDVGETACFMLQDKLPPRECSRCSISIAYTQKISWIMLWSFY